MNVKENLAGKLHSKVQKEYNDFLNYIIQKDSKEAINFSYQLVIKETMLYLFEDKIENFKVHELKALLKCSNLLDVFYYDWLKCNGTLDQDFKESLIYSTEGLIEVAQKKAKAYERGD